MRGPDVNTLPRRLGPEGSRPSLRQGLLLHFLLNSELEAAKLQLALRGSFTTKEAKGSLTVGQLWETQGKSSSRCYGYGPFIMHPRE